MNIAKRALIDAISTTLYIILVASFMFYLQTSMPKAPDNVLIPIAMLLLFVFSAGLTGALVFGKPIMLYFDGKKKEAVLLIAYTLGILFIITLIVFIFLLAYFSPAF
ncbi:hypothetical protein FJZ19_00925 [Candidatus Pacearchaeota archaeon]|nr:hypothetical protein [Candidatus Pacearchaeota archaeon]